MGGSVDDAGSSLHAFALAALDQHPGSVALVSPSGLITAVNTAWRRHADESLADLSTVGPGVDYLAVCRRSAAAGCEDARAALDGLHAVLDGRTDTFTHTYDFSFDDGPRWVELSVRRLPEPFAGALVSHVDATVERTAQAAFEAVGNWSSAIVRESPDLYSLNEPDGTVRWISPSVERLLGWSVSDLVGRNAFGLVHPDDLPSLAAQAESDRQHSGPARPAVFRMQTKTGDYRYVEATLTNLADDPDVQGMIVIARDVTERIAFQHELERLASTDPLTSLPNRATLLTELTARMADGDDPTVIAYVDLDGFRLVNDSLGHGSGDTLLTQVAERLTASLTHGEVVARIGGDEFVVVFRADVDSDTSVRRILSVFDEPFVIGEHRAVFHASIGIAASRPGHPVAPEVLLDQADTAMYAAKRATTGNWRVFDDSMRANAQRHVAIASELGQALRDGAIRPAFQPVYDLADGRLVGVESLARWHRGDGSVWSPADFLEVCESSGQVSALGRVMLDQSCRAVAEWSIGTHPWVAVNVAPEQLLDPDFFGFLDDVLDRYGLAASALQLEITESQALDHLIDPHVLARLEERGIRLALDDFGTGWSSLARLAVMPVSALKIDQSFVAAMLTDDTARAIAESVAALAGILGLQTVAEGVETPEQLAAVRALGVTSVQGYLTGRPGMLSDIRASSAEITG